MRIRRSLFAAALAALFVLALPLAAYAAPVHVSIFGNDTTGDGSSANPYRTVQRGVDAAAAGDDVYVGAGSYSNTAVNMKDGVSLYGAGSTVSVLQGTGAVPVILSNGLGAGATVSGFAITGGFCPAGSYGGGVSVVNSTITIVNNTVSMNGAAWGGGGIGVRSSTVTIKDNLIVGNSTDQYGGGIFTAFSATTITGNLIADGTATSSGGGIYALGTPGAVISNNVIVGNSCPVGQGGGIAVVNSPGTVITNNTVLNNSGSGIRASSSEPVVANCVVWGNGDDITGTVTMTYSDIEDGDPGTGNISVAPSFSSTATGDYSLTAGSPCIDAGTSSGAPASDRRGVYRPQGSAVDMGAYEYFNPAIAAPTDPTLDSETHQVDTWVSSREVTVTLSGAAGTVAPLKGFAISTTPGSQSYPTKSVTHAAGTTEYGFTAGADGTYYVNLGTVDLVSNWSSGTYYGPILIDTTAPSDPTLDSTSHDVGVPSRTTQVQLSYAGSSDGAGSGVDGYQVMWSRGATDEAPETVNESSESTTSPLLAFGDWYAHVRVVDHAGNWTDTSHIGPFVIGITTPSFAPVTTDGKSAVDMIGDPLDAASTLTVAPDAGTSIPGVASATIVGHDVLRVTFDADFSGQIDIPVTVTTGADIQTVHARITVTVAAPYSATYRVASANTSIIQWAGAGNARGYRIFVNGVPVGSADAKSSSWTFSGLLGPTSKVAVVALGGDGQESASIPATYATTAAPVKVGTLRFSGNSAKLTPSTKRALSRLATVIAAQGFTEVTVDGYTASRVRGNWFYRRWLSNARAKAVRAYLAKELARRGSGAKIVVRARGGANPIGSRDSAQNRRAEIVLR